MFFYFLCSFDGKGCDDDIFGLVFDLIDELYYLRGQSVCFVVVGFSKDGDSSGI